MDFPVTEFPFVTMSALVSPPSAAFQSLTASMDFSIYGWNYSARSPRGTKNDLTQEDQLELPQ